MKHRLKNNLSTVLAIARQSFRGHENESDDFRKFEARLLALSNGHDLITRENWDSAELKDVIEQLLNMHGRQRFEIDGPDLRLSPKSALPLTLALHELATNAGKYGALSVLRQEFPSNGISRNTSRACLPLAGAARSESVATKPKEIRFAIDRAGAGRRTQRRGSDHLRPDGHCLRNRRSGLR